MAEPDAPSAERIPEFRTVLVTTDLSELGNQAIPFAYELVQTRGAVHLLHVIESLDEPSPLYAHYTPGRRPTPEQRERQDQAIREQLSALAPHGRRRKRSVETHVIVREAHEVAREIDAVAKEIGADAICIASHGRSGLRRVLLGSVAERVLERSRIPLLVIRPQET